MALFRMVPVAVIMQKRLHGALLIQQVIFATKPVLNFLMMLKKLQGILFLKFSKLSLNALKN